MPSKVSYLIGAGASQKAHPLAKTSNEKINYSTILYSFIKENREYFQTRIKEYPQRVNILKEYLEIAEKCIEFGTPDTYAKWLHENKKKDEYVKLKKLISTYFSSRDYNPDNNEKFVTKPEPRILPFLTSIMDNGEIPENIKIISWNYDSQFEIAAKNVPVLDTDGISIKKEYLKGFSAYPNVTNSFPSYMQFSHIPFLIHLNALAGFNLNTSGLIDECIAPFVEMVATENMPSLSYAWEKEDGLGVFTNKRIEIANQMAEGTEYLVIIGYSFPFFNRHIDKQLLTTMSPTLKKIYYQEPNRGINEDDLINKFDLQISKEQIKMVRNPNQYHIPHEL